MRRKGSLGFTLVELLVVVLIIALLIAILLPALAKAREAAKKMECSSQMRQVGLAVFQYEKQFGCLPNAQLNAFNELAGFLGMVDKPLLPGQRPDAKMTAVLRCPSDSFIQSSTEYNGLSYAPVVDSGYLDDAATVGQPLAGLSFGNVVNCAWSYLRAGLGQSAGPGPYGPWTMRNLTTVAPDTFLMVEFWAPSNGVNLGTDTSPGFMSYDYFTRSYHDTTNNNEDGSMATINYTGQRCAQTVQSVWYGTFSGGAPMSGVGGYVFLAAFGQQAATMGQGTYWRAAVNKYPAISTMLHTGQMNVLIADGSVSGKYLLNIADRPPFQIPQWTRVAD
jgi:prepilin-type N-terminal cleavage/methylation domain-containing protein